MASIRHKGLLHGEGAQRHSRPSFPDYEGYASRCPMPISGTYLCMDGSRELAQNPEDILLMYSPNRERERERSAMEFLERGYFEGIAECRSQLNDLKSEISLLRETLPNEQGQVESLSSRLSAIEERMKLWMDQTKQVFDFYAQQHNILVDSHNQIVHRVLEIDAKLNEGK